MYVCMYVPNKLIKLKLYLNFRNPATKMQPRGGHLCFDLVTVRHNETLGEKIESAHDCKTDKNSYKMANSSRKGQILFFAALPRLLPWLRM